MSSKNLLIGLVAGVAAGAVLGILFAPKKGSETREKIQKIGDEYASVIKEKFNQFLDSIIDKFENAKDEASELAHQGESKAVEVFDDVSRQYGN